MLREKRLASVRVGDDVNVLDLSSTLSADLLEGELGPTRHAYFGCRDAPLMTIAGAARIMDSFGNTGGEAVSGGAADWVYLSGSVGPFRTETLCLAPGEARRMACRVLVFDGERGAGEIQRRHKVFVEDLSSGTGSRR